MNVSVQTEDIKMFKIYFVTIVRQFFSLIMMVSLLVLRNNKNDDVTNFCGLVKLFIFILNCVYLIRHIINDSIMKPCNGIWIASCIVDSCFSIQMLISVLFHFQDFDGNSIIVLNIYLMLYLLLDTMFNLIVILLTVMSVNFVMNDGALKLATIINNSSKVKNANSKVKPIQNLHQLLFCNRFAKGNYC